VKTSDEPKIKTTEHSTAENRRAKQAGKPTAEPRKRDCTNHQGLIFETLTAILNALSTLLKFKQLFAIPAFILILQVPTTKMARKLLYR